MAARFAARERLMSADAIGLTYAPAVSPGAPGNHVTSQAAKPGDTSSKPAPQRAARKSED